MPTDKKRSEKNSWVYIDLNNPNPQGIGNKAGLEHLKVLVDEALTSKRSLTKEFDCNFNQVVLSEHFPNPQKEGFTIRLLAASILILLFLGLIALGFIILLLLSS